MVTNLYSLPFKIKIKFKIFNYQQNLKKEWKFHIRNIIINHKNTLWYLLINWSITSGSSVIFNTQANGAGCEGDTGVIGLPNMGIGPPPNAESTWRTAIYTRDIIS